MPHVWEVHESRERVHAHPARWLLVHPRLAHLLDLRLMRRRRAADHLMAAEARLHRGDAGLARDRHRAVAVQTRHLVLAGVDVVTEEDGLARALEPPGVVDDGGREACSGLTSLRGSGDGDRHGDRHTHPDPTTPLLHPERSMATGSLCVWNGSRAPECSAAAEAGTSRGTACCTPPAMRPSRTALREARGRPSVTPSSRSSLSLRMNVPERPVSIGCR